MELQMQFPFFKKRNSIASLENAGICGTENTGTPGKKHKACTRRFSGNVDIVSPQGNGSVGFFQG